MELDFTQLAVRDVYAWLTRTILPRPIAWVSTVSPEGRTNLAPFSFFQGVSSKPPMLMFVPVNDRHGAKKDTLKNIEAVPEFVVNLVSHALADQMNATAAMLPHGESEFEKFHIASAPSVQVKPPRVAAAPVAFECVLHQVLTIADGPSGANVVFGRILRAHVRDEVLGADGKADAAKLDLIGRLGDADYATTRDRFAVQRPT